MIRLQCATGNPGKLREFRLAAGLAPVEIELLPGYKEIVPCVEDGSTFEDNAVIKALHYGRHASGLLFADDSGLEVDALHGAPGVFSARFSLMHPPVAGPPLPVDAARKNARRGNSYRALRVRHRIGGRRATAGSVARRGGRNHP